MGVTPLTFTGQSTYASDFQSILTRAVGIANIPLERLQNQDQTDLTKKTQLGALQATVASLTSAVQSLGNLASGQAISASSSDTSVVTVAATGATSPANYTVNSVTSLATAASETSVAGYNDSLSTTVSSTGTLTLEVGSNQYQISLTSANNNLTGVTDAINNLGAGVTASILTTGNGNYLSLSANNLGVTPLKLLDGDATSTQDLVTGNNPGTDAVFELNNLPITRTQNTINDLIPGATLTLQAPTSSQVSLTLSSDPTQLASGIQSFVSAYNAAVSQINGQTGQSGGALVGDSVILQLEGALRQLSAYQGSGSVKNLSDLGLEFQTDGTLSFDQSVFDGLSNSQVASAFQFFGSATTGFGGLSQSLDDLSNTVTGSIAVEENTLTSDDLALQTKISSTTDQINNMQQALLTQLSSADTLIVNLTAQQNSLNATLESLNYVTYGKITSN